MKTLHQMLYECGIPSWQKIYIQPTLVKNDHEHYQRQVVTSKITKLQKRFPNTDIGRMQCYGKFADGIVAKRSDGYYMINGQHHSIVAAQIGVPYLPYYMFDSSGVDHEKEVFEKFQVWEAAEGK